ncbi:hypothetical protein [Kerstersia gyiorum]|uniref:Tail assembly chaperone n=1 Tax=Kerstersia gyiorum TaxID=206506 RepID=A0A171KSH4_9BURK|nr:hypothetical protein [Kerstersia gyiorum]KKO71841.1 hypothetical protein AAV32_09725 [Kerstersia gyiorum]
MAIKKGNAPKTIPAKLEIVGGGEANVLNLTFHNRKGSEFDVKIEELKETQEPFIPNLVLFIVKEWDTDFSLSLEGILEFEDERPGICNAILKGYHKVRAVELEGN